MAQQATAGGQALGTRTTGAVPVPTEIAAAMGAGPVGAGAAGGEAAEAVGAETAGGEALRARAAGAGPLRAETAGAVGAGPVGAGAVGEEAVGGEAAEAMGAETAGAGPVPAETAGGVGGGPVGAGAVGAGAVGGEGARAVSAESVGAVGWRWRWWVLGVLLVAEAMNLLDATIVQVAAPVIHSDLGGRASDIQWFGAAYTLPFAALLITGGRLGDIAGRKRVFRIGVVGFLVTSSCCALAPNAGVLIGARALQGAAAALVIPQTIGLIRAMFDAAELPKALGSIGPVMGLAGICGPLLGGILTHADLFGSSWRSVFAVNLPLGVAVLVATPLMREDRAPQKPGLDLLGSALLVAGSALVLYPIIQVEHWGYLPAGFVVLAGCVVQQRRRRKSGRAILVESSLFGNCGFAPALVTSTLFFAMTTGVTLVVVLHLQVGLHHGVLRSSLTLLPWSAAIGISSWIAGAVLIPRYGTKVMFGGLGLMLAGLGATVAVYNDSRIDWPLFVALGVCGLGMGFFTTPFFTAALHRVRPHETGSAAGLLNAVQQLGGTLGIALLGTIFLRSLTSETPARAAETALWTALALTAATTTAAAFMSRGHD